MNRQTASMPAAPAHGWLEYRVGGFSLELEWYVPPGTVLALFGPSGAGKTTLLRIIAGLLRPQRGHIELGGQVVFDSGSGAWLPPHRRRAGYLTQQHHLFPHLTVAGNIAYGLRKRNSARARERVQQLIRQFKLEGLENRRPDQISGGQQQRAALARALAPGPAALLLDEPFTSLDAELRRTLRGELQAQLTQAGVPVILVSHDIEEVLSVADMVQVIADGRVQAAGAPLDVLGQPGQSRTARLVGVENLLPMRVITRFPRDGTMTCAGSGLQLEVPLGELNPGEAVSVGIRASDIILAQTEPVGSSARNRLTGLVTGVELRPPGYEVTLNVGAANLKCHITGASLAEMEIRPGKELWAVFKASSCFLVQETNYSGAATSSPERAEN